MATPKKKASPANYVNNGLELSGPVVIGANAPAVKDMVTLFILNDREYQIPRKVDPRIPIRLAKSMSKCKTEEEKSLVQLSYMEDLLGAESFEALMDTDQVSPEEFEQVMNYMNTLALGESESGKG